MSLVSEVQTLVDEASGPVFWVIQQVYDACNVALEETWATQRLWNYTSVPFTLTSGADIVAINTATIMVPLYILDTAQNKIFVTEHAQLQDWSTNWRNTTPARPCWVVKWDSDHLRIYPRSNATYTYTMVGIPWPPEISASQLDITGIDPIIRSAVVQRAVSRLLEFTQPELSDKYELQAQENQKQFERQQRRQQGSNVLRLRPSKGWTVGMNGDIRIARKYN